MNNRALPVRLVINAFFILSFTSFLVLFLYPDWLFISQSGVKLESFVAQGKDSAPITVSIAIIPVQTDSSYEQALLEVREIRFFSEKVPEDAVAVCVSALTIKTLGASKVWNGFENHWFLPDKLCKPLDFRDPQYIHSMLYEKDQDSISLSELTYLENDPFYYPYDKFTLEAGAFISISFLDKPGTVIEEEVLSPRLLIYAEGNTEWERRHYPSPYTDFWELFPRNEHYQPLIDEGLYQPDIIVYSRPLIVRIIFPIIIFSFLAFIYLLAIVDSLELFFGGSVAVLVGLFGMREVLTPVAFPVKTLVDTSILMLYVAFAVATLIQVMVFVPKFFKQRDSNARQSNRITKKKLNRNV